MDADLALRVRNREPNTLDLACRLAARLEANQRSGNRRDDQDRRAGRIKTICESETALEQLMRRLSDQMVKMERRQSQLKQLLATMWSSPDRETEQTFVKHPLSPTCDHNQAANEINRDNRRCGSWKRCYNDKCYKCH